MFKTVKYLLFEDRRDIDSEILEDFVPYLVTRYLSMYDKDFIHYANDTLNVYGNLFNDKEEQFRFYENVIPRLKRKDIKYIKRKRLDTPKKKHIPEFMSEREYDEYFDTFSDIQ
jgi:hypothetical protein